MGIPDDLNRRFGIPGVVAIDAGQGGLARVVVTGSLGMAHVYLHGAHVTHFQPAERKPLLFMSGKSHFADGKPIRGGVPICFPWFGPKAGDSAAPAHGFARLLPWELVEATQSPDGSVIVAFELKSSDATRAQWPADFLARYQVHVGKSLQLTLQVANLSAGPATFEEALHTYFSVGDIKSIRIDGLAGKRFIDKVDGAKEKIQPPRPITIEGETDRVYLDTAETVTISDPTIVRRILVAKSGSHATVVWNPWINKARAMADFGDEEWPGMLCVETANVAGSAITLAAGATHEMRAIIATESLS